MSIAKQVILLLLCLIGYSLDISAQTEKVKNLPYADYRQVHFGFLLGMHTQDIAFSHTGFVGENGESWYAEQPGFSPGFSVGLLASLSIIEQLELRLTPTMHFGNRYITLKESESSAFEKQDIKANIVAIPLNVKYSSKRINNYRPYITAGISPSIDLSKKKNTPIVLNRFDFAIELGLGLDLYLPYFKLIPELRFSFGLVDLIKHDRPDLKDPNMIKYTKGIESAKSRSVSLIFYFE